MALSLSEDKPHRKASNSCLSLYNEMITCYQESPCFKELNRPFIDCLSNLRPQEVNEECLILRKAYAQCRRNLLKGQYRVMGNPYS